MLLSYIKRGAYTTFFYAGSTALVRGMNFLFLPFFLSRLTLAEFGVWDFYQLFFSTGTLLLSSCAATSMIRFYVLYKDDDLKQKQSLGNAFLFVLVSACVFPIIAYSFLYFGKLFPISSEFLYLTLISVCSFALFTLFLSFLRVQEKLWYYVLVFCGQNFLAVVGTLLAVNYNFGIKSFFYANFISFFVFIPCFIYLFIRYRYFSFAIFKEQISYSVPLLIYALIYISFFTTDKLLLKHYGGYEALGLYSLLWRFGGIFQMATIAMIDAWYIIVYNAQKEQNSNFIISKLITYYSVALTTCCLYVVVGARLIIELLFPVKYYYLITYLPFFFLSLLFIEIARVFQTAFGLSIKTFYMPVISLIIACLQAVLLFYFISYNIWGIFIANTIAFLGYALLSYWISQKAYHYQLISKEKIGKLLIVFTCCIGTLHCLFNKLFSIWYSIILVVIVWPILVWQFDILGLDEKEWIISKISFYNSVLKSRNYFLKKSNQ